MDSFIAGVIAGASGLQGACAANNLDRYLKAIGADLPLPEGAEGWFARKLWSDVRWLTYAEDGRTAIPVCRWRPFSSY